MVTLLAGMLFPHGADNPEGVAYQFQLLGRILAEVESAPPQSGQHVSAGGRRFSSRGSDAGNGLRVHVWRNGRGTGGHPRGQ